MKTQMGKTVLFIALIIVIHGCGGGGSDGGSNADAITTPDEIVTFMGITAGGTTVSMRQNNGLSKNGVLAIDIRAQNLTTVYGIATDIEFDSSKLAYSDYSAGSYLENGGKTVTYAITPQIGAGNRIILGISRLGNAGEASGNGTFVTLKFRIVAPGRSTVNFINPFIRNANNQPVSGISWYGGTATVWR